jgi:hypothetical protein
MYPMPHLPTTPAWSVGPFTVLAATASVVLVVVELPLFVSVLAVLLLLLSAAAVVPVSVEPPSDTLPEVEALPSDPAALPPSAAGASGSCAQAFGATDKERVMQITVASVFRLISSFSWFRANAHRQFCPRQLKQTPPAWARFWKQNKPTTVSVPIT